MKRLFASIGCGFLASSASAQLPRTEEKLSRDVAVLSDSRAMAARHKPLVETRLSGATSIEFLDVYVTRDERTQAPIATCGAAWVTLSGKRNRVMFAVSKADRVVVSLDEAWQTFDLLGQCGSSDTIFVRW